MLPQIGSLLLWLALLGTVFLAIDVRARDSRDGLSDVLDAKPLSNMALVLGRVLAIAALGWLPIFVVALVLQAVGTAAVGFHWWMGAPLEPVSLAAFLLLDAPAVLIAWCAVVVLLVIVCRSRLAVAMISFGGLVALSWVYARLPAYLLGAVLPVSSYGEAISELAPRFGDVLVIAQRGALLAFAVAAMLVAAACYPRRDAASVPRLNATAAVLALVGVITVVSLGVEAFDRLDKRAKWLTAHRLAADDIHAVPRLRHVSGQLRIVPGEALYLDVRMQLAVPPTVADALVFTLNPGLVVADVEINGTDSSFRHEDGLLTVGLAPGLVSGALASLAVKARGVPDPDFAYLDSAVDWRNRRVSQLHFLGTRSALFERSYVALMPGVFWLPRPGTAVPAQRESGRGMDWHSLDLEVEVPGDWVVAGPGCVAPVDDEPGSRRFRLRPLGAVSDVGFFASRFVVRTGRVGNVRVELLVSPKHERNLEFFEDEAEALRNRLRAVLEEADSNDLSYPYDCLSVVEVPASLRSYGGGWRMHTALALPGVFLLRERGFPTAHYDRTFANPLPVPKARLMEIFLVGDYSGGGVLEGVSKNLLLGQVAVAGEGAEAVEYVLHELTGLALLGPTFGRTQMSSARLFDVELGLPGLLGGTVRNLVSGPPLFVMPQAAGIPRSDLDAWAHVATVPVAQYPSSNSLSAVNALVLRGDAVARALYDGLGRKQVWRLLAELRRRHSGANIGWRDVEIVAAGLGLDVASLVGDWINDPSLPGFQASVATVTRLPDSNDGQPRYDVRVHVRNTERSPGVVRLSEEDYGFRALGEPVRIGGHTSVEIGLVLPNPPEQLWLMPNLSLNRDPVRLRLSMMPRSDDVEPLNGARRSTWRPPGVGGIVVDDLDTGFSIEADATVPEPRTMRRSPSSPRNALVRVPDETGWRRRNVPGSWGKYLHTATMATPGNGRARAVFTANIRTHGRYDLEYHIPDRDVPMTPGIANSERVLFGELGELNMTVRTPNGEVSVNFDARAAASGWNKVRSFELGVGEVSVVVSDQTNGTVAVADAVRWRLKGETDLGRHEQDGS